MKVPMTEIAANDNLKNRLRDNILSGKFSHAYIIEGKQGSGRHLLALNIAKAISCKSKDNDGIPLPCNSCRSCTLISEFKSPDVITVSRDPDRMTLGVDKARFIKNDVVVYPVELKHKIYIIEEADKLTVQAQNALLLTLEEPPEYAVFLLLCEQSSLLLETVRSRAPIIRTESIPGDVIKKFLCEKSPYREEARALSIASREEFDELIMASDGCIGMAYKLLDPELRADVIETRGRVRRFISAAITRKSYEDIITALIAFSQKRDAILRDLEASMVALRDIIVLKKSEDAPLCFYSDREEALELSSKRPMIALAELYSLIEEASVAIDRSANVKLTITDLASRAYQK